MRFIKTAAPPPSTIPTSSSAAQPPGFVVTYSKFLTVKERQRLLRRAAANAPGNLELLMSLGNEHLNRTGARADLGLHDGSTFLLLNTEGAARD